MSPASNFPGSPSFRTPGSPVPSRQTSIVEMLSTPPPLENNSDVSQMDLSSAVATSPSSAYFNQGSSLSRNPSTSSQSSSGVSTLNSAFSLDWKDISLSELVESNKLITINNKISVEEAFETLVNHNLTSVPVEECSNDLNCLTFDYTDLNSYLLLVLNKLKSTGLQTMDYTPKEDIPLLVEKAQRGEQVPVEFVIKLTNKDPFLKLHESDKLSTVVEILGSGVHRIAITKDQTLTGILSQRRLIKYLWDNARRFPSMEPLLSSSLHSLNIGSNKVVSIYGDQLLIEAFVKMHDLMISSLAVIDRNNNLLGNISVTDVRLVSKSSKSDLLYKNCLHFISVILNSRGLENGKDSFPIFHVTSSSSLARTIAKLVATKSHRLWIVKPSSSEEPKLSAPVASASVQASSSMNSNSGSQFLAMLNEKEHSGRPGRLVGVISLTDILSVMAKTLGKDHVDPSTARKQRRRSSSSSSRSGASIVEQFRKSVANPSDR